MLAAREPRALIVIDVLVLGELIPAGAVCGIQRDLFSREEAIDARRHAALPDEPVKSVINAAGRAAPDFEPGSSWRYSNTGFVLLGRIIEIVTRKNYY